MNIQKEVLKEWSNNMTKRNFDYYETSNVDKDPLLIELIDIAIQKTREELKKGEHHFLPFLGVHLMNCNHCDEVSDLLKKEGASNKAKEIFDDIDKVAIWHDNN